MVAFSFDRSKWLTAIDEVLLVLIIAATPKWIRELFGVIMG